MLQSINMSTMAVKSMQAIDDWMDTVNANLNGLGRNAFKESDISFGGNTTYILKNPRLDRAGEMIGEQALTVGNTRINWNQGTIVSSTEETHFAIQGEGFFMVQKPGTLSPAPFLDVTYFPAAGTTASGAGDVYLTRDGEFHWGLIPGSNTEVLLDKNGFLVLSDHGDANNVLGTITRTGFDTPEAPPPALTRIRPSIVIPTISKDSLLYSEIGSTYFNFGQGVPVTANVIVDGSSGQLDNAETKLLEKSLEASNVSTEKNITHLSMLGKIYNGFVQLIKVYNSNTDEVLGFIR